jgi:acyl-CoA dehydrogenase
MIYSAPVDDTIKALRTVAQRNMDGAGLDEDTLNAILGEAGRFADERIAPLDWPADRFGVKLANRQVTTAPGFAEVYKDWQSAGWNGLSAAEAAGGQGLPLAIGMAATEFWNGACMAFALAPLLTAGAIEVLSHHGSEAIKAEWLGPLVEGRFTGTMNLTEPQSGSDLSGLRCKAERAGDGTYRLRGQKIYITYGEHDLSENIVHLVLARLPDAPAGTGGISLFLAPKILPDGSRNDLFCQSVEHKLGIHASPTCVMIFGENEGAKAWLIGEENRGLAAMFLMMNNARLAVGIQGVALAEKAVQRARAFAATRRQGKAPGASGSAMIEGHPDVRRMLLSMQARTLAARLLCLATANALDEAAHGDAGAADIANLLTPLAKAYATDVAVANASTGIQIHGGMGFVEETGAAQLYRDARILPIYEGTNGIQAIDLVTRKLGLSGGETVAVELGRCKAAANALAANADPMLSARAAYLFAALDALEKTKDFLTRQNDPRSAASLAGATPFLALFATVSSAAWLATLALSPLASQNDKRACCHYLETDLPAAAALEATILHGHEAICALG